MLISAICRKVIGTRSIRVIFDDLEWPWKARRKGFNFPGGSLYRSINSAQIRQAFNPCGGGASLRGSATPPIQGGGVPAHPIFELLLTPTSFDLEWPNSARYRITKFCNMTELTNWRTSFYKTQHAPTVGGGASGHKIVIPLLMLILLDLRECWRAICLRQLTFLFILVSILQRTFSGDFYKSNVSVKLML